ncbi:MAG: hypothetical protein V2I63_03670, partial [Pseudomonadales bacterium]|nr:hypothetical protein [Pseudomonadales bacterium]
EIEATAADGTGGRVDLFGDRVATDGATIDVSGTQGGGRIRIGGGLRGDPAVPAARATVVDADTRLVADATVAGPGGNVVVWSEGTTDYAGTLSARGAGSGDGGFAEVSGRGALRFAGAVDLSSPAGAAGALLLDPENLRVVAGGSNSGLNGDPEDTDGDPFRYGFAEGPVPTSEIDPAAILTILDTGTTVTLQATNDLTVDAALDASGAVTPGGGLTLQAGNDIRVNETILLRDGDLTLSANDPGGPGTGSGALFLDAPVDVGSGTVLIDLNGSSAGAALRATLTGGALTLNGAALLGADITTVGAQLFSGPVTLEAALGLTTSDAPISFLGTLDGAFDLSLDAGLGAVRLEQATGAITPLASLSVDGAAALGADITTAGAQLFSGPVTLEAALGLTTSDAPISFLGTLDGAFDLSIETGLGTLRFADPVGGLSPLGALEVLAAGDLVIEDGLAAQTLGVASTGAVAIDGAVSIGAGGVDLRGASVRFTAPLDSGGDLLVDATAGALELAAASPLSANGLLRLEASGGVDLGSDLSSNGANLEVLAPLRLADGVRLSTGGGDLSLGAITGNGFDLQLVSGAGSALVAGAVSGLGTLRVQEDAASATGAVRFVDDVDALGLVTYARPYELAFTGASTAFADPVTTLLTGVLRLGDGGDLLAFDGGLDARSAQTFLGGTLRTQGAALRVGALQLTAASALDSGVGGGDLRLDGFLDGAFDLSLDAGTGDIVLGTAAGSVERLGVLTLGSATNVDLDLLSASGLSITGVSGTLRQNAAVDLVGATGADLRAQQIEILAALDVTGGGAVLDALGLLDVRAPISVSDALRLDAGGALALGADLSTAGGDLFIDTDALLASDLSLTTAGGALQTAALDGPFALQISAGSGAIRLGTVGQAQAIESLSIQSAARTELGGDLRTQGAAGIELSGAGEIQLAGAARLDGAAGGGGIDLGGSTLDGAADLVLDGGAGGVRLGAVGPNTPLSSLDVLGATTLAGDLSVAGAVRFRDSVAIASPALTMTANEVRIEGALSGDGSQALTIDGALDLAAGVSLLDALTVSGTALLGADVVTEGAQDYQTLATLAGGDRRLEGSSVRLAGVDGNGNGLTIAGGLDLRAALSDVSALTVSGPSRLGADVTTSGAQSYLGSTDIVGAARRLEGTTLNLAAVRGDTGAEALTLIGDLFLSGDVTQLGALSLTGAADLGGDVETSGAQRYTGSVALRGAERRLAGSLLRFDAAVTGIGAGVRAIFDGAVDLNAPVTQLETLRVTGDVDLGADVSTAAAQTYEGLAVLSGGARRLEAGSVSLADVDGGGQALTIAGDLLLDGTALGLQRLDVAGTTAFAGVLETGEDLQFATPLTLLGGPAVLRADRVTLPGIVGGGAPLLIDGELLLTAAGTGLGSLEVTGPTTLAAGVTSSGVQRYGARLDLAGGARTLTAQRVFVEEVAGAGFGLTVNGGLTSAGPLDELARLAVTGPATVGGDVTTVGDQLWSGRVDPIDGARVFSGNRIDFAGGVQGAGAGLSVVGDLGVGAPITGLSTLQVTGATLLGADVATTGVQRYDGELQLTNGARVLSGSRVELGPLRGAGLDLEVLGALDLRAAASGLGRLTVTGDATLGADVTTTDSQAYAGVVTLTGGDRILQGAQVSMGELVGSGDGLGISGSLALAGDGSGLAFLDVAGAAVLAGDVTTLGSQRYGGAVSLGGGSRVLTGSDLVFEGTLVGAGATALTVGGPFTLGGVASGLASLTVAGPSLLGGDVETSGAQRYLAPVTLTGGARTLRGTRINLPGLTGSGGALLVDGDLDLDGAASGLSTITVTGASDLAANLSSTGVQRFVGATTLRGGARLLSAPEVRLEGGVAGATGSESLLVSDSLVLGAAATDLSRLDVDGDADLSGDVTTAGAQRYGGATLLRGPVRRLSGASLAFQGPVTGLGAPALFVDGALDLGGTATGLAALEVDGSARLAGDVVTRDGQRYLAPVALGASVALGTAGGDIVFLDALDGAGFDLALDTVDGRIDFAAAAQGLGDLTLTEAAALRFAGPLGAASLTAAASPASLAFDGAVSISGATRLASTGGIRFGDDGDLQRFAGGLEATASDSILNGRLETLGAPLTLGDLVLGGASTIRTASAQAPVGAALVLGGLDGAGFDVVLDAGTGGDLRIDAVEGVAALALAGAGDARILAGLEAERLDVGAIGSLRVEGDARLESLDTADAGPALLRFDEDLTVSAPVVLGNSGGLELGDASEDVYRFEGGLDGRAGATRLAGRLVTPSEAVLLGDLRVAADALVDLTDAGDPALTGADLRIEGRLEGDATPDLELRAGTGALAILGDTSGLGALVIRSAQTLELGAVDVAGDGIRAVVAGDIRLQGDVLAAEGDIGLFATDGRILQAEDSRIRTLDGNVDLVARDGMALFEVAAPSGDIRLQLLDEAPGAAILRVGSFAKQTPDFSADGLISVVTLGVAEFGGSDNGFLVDGREQFLALGGGRAFIDGSTAASLATLSGSQQDAIQETLIQTGLSALFERPFPEDAAAALGARLQAGSSFVPATSLALQQRFQALTQQTQEQAPLTGLTDAVFTDITLFDYDRERPLCLPAALQGPNGAPCAAAEAGTPPGSGGPPGR